MDDISKHKEPCPLDPEHLGRQIYKTGMIKVSGGSSPTRFRDGSYQSVAKSKDPGLQREFSSIWDEGGAPENPNTKERYEIMDDEGGSGQYMSTPGDKEQQRKDRAAHEEATAKGTLPTKKEQDASRYRFLDNQLTRARERKRGLHGRDLDK